MDFEEACHDTVASSPPLYPMYQGYCRTLRIYRHRRAMSFFRSAIFLQHGRRVVAAVVALLHHCCLDRSSEHYLPAVASADIAVVVAMPHIEEDGDVQHLYY